MPGNPALKPGQLAVVPHDRARLRLNKEEYGLIVTVGIRQPNIFIPTLLVGEIEPNTISPEEKKESFSATHAAWSAGKSVMIICHDGMIRSPCFSELCLADYYGPGREQEAAGYVMEHTHTRCCPPNEGLLKSILPLLADDEVACWFMLNRFDFVKDRLKQTFYILQHRILKRKKINGHALEDLQKARGDIEYLSIHEEDFKLPEAVHAFRERAGEFEDLCYEHIDYDEKNDLVFNNDGLRK